MLYSSIPIMSGRCVVAAKAAMLHPSSSSTVWYEEADAALLVAEGILQSSPNGDGNEGGENQENQEMVRKLRGELERRQRDYAKNEKSMYLKMLRKKNDKLAKRLENK